jgi:hypothetical protein
MELEAAHGLLYWRRLHVLEGRALAELAGWAGKVRTNLHWQRSEEDKERAFSAS